jgi:hypothetical protein
MDELKDEPVTDTALPAEGPEPEPPARAPTWEELHREQAAFAATMPPPTEAEMKAVLADLGWFCEHQDDPAVQAHLGDYVAVMGGKVLGGGDDSDRLRLHWARKLGVHPARVAVAWVDDGRDLTVTFPDEDEA